MSEFLTELCVDLKPGRDDVWILRKPLIYISDLVGRIEAPEAFETDFCTVPRVPIVYALWGNTAHREGTLHDFLFRTDSVPNVSWMMANRVFLEVMEVRDKPFWTRYPMFTGVCIGSYSCYHKRLVGDKL